MDPKGELLALALSAPDSDGVHTWTCTVSKSCSLAWTQKVVTQDALSGALIEHMQRRFDRVFSAETCSFSFFEGTMLPNTGLNISVAELLVERGQA